MNSGPNKPIAAKELTELELEDIAGGKENAVSTAGDLQLLPKFELEFAEAAK